MSRHFLKHIPFGGRFHEHFHARFHRGLESSFEGDPLEGFGAALGPNPRAEHDPRFCAAGRGEFEGGFEASGRHGFGRGFGGHFGGHGPGGFGGHGPGDFGDRFEGGFGRGRSRMFDAGDLKIVVMKLLSEQPSYGYQLIKTMEQRFAGGYTPSAGVIYPTLTLLEEEGLAAVATENGKKVYSVTPEGQKFLEENKERVGEIFSRIDEAGRSFERERAPELIKAFMNLRGSVIARVARGNAGKEQIRKIVDAINAAAKTIDEF